MKIKVTFKPSNKKKVIELEAGSSVYDLLKKIGMKPDSTLILKNKTPIPIDEIIEEDIELDIVQVASGG